MGDPWFQLKDKVRDHGLIGLSSNYTLYGDMSARVMTILRDMAPRQEVYSIDECFLDMKGMKDRRQHGQAMRGRILSWTGLPVCVGIGASKTEAKLANFLAKKRPQYESVCDLAGLTDSERRDALGSIDVSEVWGIGSKLTAKLASHGIETALDLRDADIGTLRKCYGVVMERTIRELRGDSCLQLEMVARDRKEIMCSRSFSRDVTRYEELRESVLTYVCRAAEKLRRQKSETSAVMVFVHTNPHKDVAQYGRQAIVQLPAASDDTLILARAAVQGLQNVFRDGYHYKKSGTMLMDLAPKSLHQATLFNGVASNAKHDRLNAAMDKINARYGRSTVALAGAGLEKPWKLRAENRSPPYTTDWYQLPRVS